jgi:hypothetical protein
MTNYSISTHTGGLIELITIRDRFAGNKLAIHMDMSFNNKNTEGDCFIPVNNGEIKALMAILNEYLIDNEGVPYMALAAPLMHESVKITVDEEFMKNIS